MTPGEGGSGWRHPGAATLVVVLGCLALGAVSTMESHQVSVVHGFPMSWWLAFLTSFPRWLFLAFALPVALAVSMRVSLEDGVLRALSVHVALCITIIALHAIVLTWMTGFLQLGVQRFGLADRLLRAFYNGTPLVAPLYGGVVAAAWALKEAGDRERRSVRASQLEAQLAVAHLAALRARFQPHFLYNTLHGIAALVADEKNEPAVEALEHLSELLHASLRDEEGGLVPLEKEFSLVRRYLELQRTRFGERLSYGLTLPTEVAGAQVPVLLLQPLVENAVIHGLETGRDRLHLSLMATPIAKGVEVRVENDGDDVPDLSTRSRDGVGLATTRARLVTAFGERASLNLGPRTGGGAVVTIVIPRPADPETDRG